MLKQTRPLPTPASLAEAIALVISGNKEDGYPTPTRFIGKVGGKTGSALIAACNDLITNPVTIAHLEKEFDRYPTLLTLEDLVARYGQAWGFSQQVIEQAKANAQWFDQRAGYRRYA